MKRGSQRITPHPNHSAITKLDFRFFARIRNEANLISNLCCCCCRDLAVWAVYSFRKRHDAQRALRVNSFAWASGCMGGVVSKNSDSVWLSLRGGVGSEGNVIIMYTSDGCELGGVPLEGGGSGCTNTCIQFLWQI